MIPSPSLLMPAQVSSNPSLSRSRYPPPLYFDSNGTHLRSPASPNKVDKDRHSLLPAGNTRYEDRPADATARPTDMFDRNNSNNSSTTYSSDAYSTAPSQPEQQRALSPPLNSHKPPPAGTASRDLEISTGRYVSDSPSPIEIHPTSSFPHPLSAPHSQEHFSNSNTPASFGSEMNRYPSLHDSDRYLRNGTHPQPSGVDKYSLPSVLDHHRRMSEPSVFGSSGSAQSSAYPNPTAEPSAGRYQQMQFAFNPPPQSPRSPYSSSLHRGTSTGSLRELHHHQQTSPPWKTEEDMHLHLHPFGGGLDEPISPLNPTFSGGAHSPTLGLSGHPYPAIAEDPYGPSPPGTGTSTSSNTPGNRNLGSGGAHSGSSSSSKTYSFVSLPGNAVKKRPRRRYDEIERLYQCSWPDCAKAYGTLNHLNAHVTMQKHGSKRSPNEFKELRKQWRKAKKEEEITRTHPGHLHNVSRRGSLQHDRILESDLHLYPHHRHSSHHHHPYHHSAHGSLIPSSVSVPSLGPDGRYTSVPIESVRYPPPEELDGLPRGHGAEDAFRRGSHPDLRSQARYHSSHSGPGPWHPSMASSRAGHYLPSSHSSSQLGLPANADISLNRLGPDSTLLTPLPGYEPPSLGQVESGLNMYGGYANGSYNDDDNRPDTGHGSLYDDGRPGTGQGSLYDDRPSTGNGSLYDDRPGTGHGSLYGDDRPGTGHRSLYDDGRPRTGNGNDHGEFRHM